LTSAVVSTITDGSDGPAPLGALETTTTSDPRSPFVGAHLKLAAALKQRRLGLMDLARFNFSRAETEFDACGAIGWSRLAASQLGEAIP
jgi:hypothetical protein